MRKKPIAERIATKRAYARAYYQKHKAEWKEYARIHLKEIQKYRRAYREKNRERLNEYTKNYKATHPVDKVKQYNYWRKYRLKTHGMTMADYDALLQQQGGRCAICGRNSGNHKKTTAFQVDHDHKTGTVRGLLCTSCNRGIGWFVDSIPNLRMAIAYLERYQPRQTMAG